MKRLAFFLPLVLLCCVPSHPLRAQEGQSVSADLTQEQKDLGNCKRFDFKGISSCAEAVFTGKPLHVVVGSLAPQNGVGGGLGFSEMWHPTFCPSWMDFTAPPRPGTRNPCHWAASWNVEAEATGNGSWRAGGYAEFSRISARTPHPHSPGQPHSAARSFSRPSPLIDLYSQSTSLNRIYFYGPGPITLPRGRAAFGFTENVTGLDAIVPLPASALDKAGISILGELNGRFPSVRGNHGDSSPSIEAVYTELAAPGLSSQPVFLQFGEGVRLVPAFPYNVFRLNYLVNFQQFIAPSDDTFSFRRLTFDLNHQVPIYTIHRGQSATSSAAHPAYVPLTPTGLPNVSPTQDFTGSVSVRLLIEESTAKAGSVVPFYFQPTLGGSDINNQSMLASYPDYRFRAPNLLLLRGSFEQSLGKFPVGLFLSYDEGKVASRRDDIAFAHLRHTYTAGLTVHAGGLPVLALTFSWGGPEGHHTAATVSNALLGASVRPSLF